MFRVPITELLKRPGNMRELQVAGPLRFGIGTEVIGIPEGENLSINLRLESVHEGILATGLVSSSAKGLCSRCLEPLEINLEVDFQELFAYSSSSDDDLLVENDEIDLEQVVIDSVVLNLPFQPICNEACLGLCQECGFVMEKDPGHQHLKQVDARFEALKDLLSKEE